MTTQELDKALEYLNDYPLTQNCHPSYEVSSDGKRLSYYRQYSDKCPSATITIQKALTANSITELQATLC
jgi:hypothetical protein